MNMMRWIAAATLVALACGREAEVPVDRVLLRVAGAWEPVTRDAGDARRISPGTILILRNNKDFVEFHGWLLEQPDDTLYISSRHGHTVALGRWREDGAEIKARRDRVHRRTRAANAAEPFCADRDLTFRVSATSLIGEAGEGSPGQYSPITRLVAPDFESYVDAARQSGVQCEAQR